jgi:hypothetical protein
MSASALAPALAPALLSTATLVAHQASLLPITINSISLAGVIGSTANLVANATAGGQNFQIPLALSNATPNATTPILELQLNAIHLNLLGLQVDTSNICLDITAQSGPGNLLGNLLTDVAHLLDQGLPLTGTGGLTTSQLNSLTSGLTGLLNGAFGALGSPTNAASGASVSSQGTTNILHLSLGPLDLNLLGLQVHLDNCNNGPVTIDITAQSGPGNLLGNLLGGLAHLLDSNANTTAIINKLEKIAGEIAAII